MVNGIVGQRHEREENSADTWQEVWALFMPRDPEVQIEIVPEYFL